MDAATAQKIVESLDRELARRREKRDREEEQRWREESDDDPVVFARQYLDHLGGRVGAESPEEAAAIVMASAVDDADRAKLERVEQLAEWIRATADMVTRLEARREDVEAGIRRRRPVPKLRVRSMAKLLSDVNPRPDPAAPKPVERTGRRGEAPLVQPGAPQDGVWQRGMVLTFNPRAWEGAVRAGDGKELRWEVGRWRVPGL